LEEETEKTVVKKGGFQRTWLAVGKGVSRGRTIELQRGEKKKKKTAYKREVSYLKVRGTLH